MALSYWLTLLGPMAGVLASLGMAVASALAIFRYRLWDIDIIIRHTLQYGLLSASLALVYFSSIVLLQRLLQRATGQGSTLAIVGSTLMIAALFSPFRKRIQGFIDRRFYRRQYDIEQIMPSFSAGLREDGDLEQMSRRLEAIVKETLQPESLSLWLMEPGGSQPGPAAEAPGTAIRP